MKGFLLRCFHGRNPRPSQRAPKGEVNSDAGATTNSRTLVEANNGILHPQPASKSGASVIDGPPTRPSSGPVDPDSDVAAVLGSQAQECTTGVGFQTNSTKGSSKLSPNDHEQEMPAPRLSLDCGLGAGPNATPDPARPPAAGQLPVPLRTFMAPNTVNMHRGSVESGVSSGVESAVSDGSSGALVVRGGGAAAVLGLGPGDASTSRQLVSRALRGRASLDALLMLGALVRAADEAGIAMSALAATPRLERIESGDLPPGEDRDLNTQQRQHPHSQQPHRQQSGRRAAPVVASNKRSCEAGNGNSPGAVSGWPIDVDGGGGGAATGGGPGAASTTLGLPRPPIRRVAPRWLYGSSGAVNSNGILPGAAFGSSGGGSSATAAAAAAAAGAFGDFTFSPPTISARLSNDNRSACSSDAQLYAQQAAADAQVFELFMRLVTNASTTTTTMDAELFGSTAPTGDRSSAGTAAAMGTGTSTSTGPGQGTNTGMVVGVPAVGRHGGRRGMQRSVSEANRGQSYAHHHHPNYPNQHHQHQHQPQHYQQHTLQGRAGRSGFGGVPGSVSAVAHGGARGVAGRAMAGPRRRPEDAASGGSALVGNFGNGGGSSAPLFHLPLRLVAMRRNSWDTVPPAPGALAVTAAAALTAARMLRSSPAGVVPGSAATNTSSGKMGGYSSSRFWPTAGGILQDDSGPASLLLVGALSGHMSMGGATSANSLVRLPTGSGSIRDVLSRIQHQQLVQHQLLHEGTNAASSGSWSNHTGLASLFDVHLTAALRRAGAVRTFQRAVGGAGGPATLSLSRASSSVYSHLTGPLARQDTSMTFTGGLMQLQMGRNSSSTPGSSTGAAGAASGAAGVSQLGAAAAAGGSNAGGGLLAGGVPAAPHVRRANLSSVSTIHSVADSSRETAAAAAVGAPAAGGCRNNVLSIASRTSGRLRSSEQPRPGYPLPPPGLEVGPGSESGGGAGSDGGSDSEEAAAGWMAVQRNPTLQPGSNLRPPSQQQNQQGPFQQRGVARWDSGGSPSPSHPWPHRVLQPPQRQASGSATCDSGCFSGGGRGCTTSSYGGLASQVQEERGSLSLALGLAPVLHHGGAPGALASSVGTASGALTAGPSGTIHSSRPLSVPQAGASLEQEQGGSGTVPQRQSTSLDFAHCGCEKDWDPRRWGPGEREVFTFTGGSSLPREWAGSGGAAQREWVERGELR